MDRSSAVGSPEPEVLAKAVAGGLKYVACFEAQVFDEKCEVEVVAPLPAGDFKVTVSWKPFLGPSSTITLEDLELLAKCVADALPHVGLLRAGADDAAPAQLRCDYDGASFQIVHPEGKEPLYALSAGPFHRAGKLERLSSRELDDAIAALEEFKSRVKQRIAR